MNIIGAVIWGWLVGCAILHLSRLVNKKWDRYVRHNTLRKRSLHKRWMQRSYRETRPQWRVVAIDTTCPYCKSRGSLDITIYRIPSQTDCVCRECECVIKIVFETRLFTEDEWQEKWSAVIGEGGRIGWQEKE